MEQTLPEIDREGYTFHGWYELDKGQGDKITYINMPDVNGNEQNNSDVTIYSYYVPNEYTVRYNINAKGNASASAIDKTHTYDMKKPLESNMFANDGYTFIGWAESANGLVKYNNNEEVENLATSGVKNLYAKWKGNEYQINCDPNGGYIDGGTNSKNIKVIYHDQIVNLPFPSRIGYTFKGWKYNNITIANGQTYAYPHAIGVSAEWQLATYDISYNLNGGTVTSSLIKSYTIGLEKPIKIGYIFNNWTCNGSIISEISKGSAGDKYLTANWTEDVVDIENGYNDTVSRPESENYIKVTLDLNSATDNITINIGSGIDEIYLLNDGDHIDRINITIPYSTNSIKVVMEKCNFTGYSAINDSDKYNVLYSYVSNLTIGLVGENILSGKDLVDQALSAFTAPVRMSGNLTINKSRSDGKLTINAGNGIGVLSRDHSNTFYNEGSQGGSGLIMSLAGSHTVLVIDANVIINAGHGADGLNGINGENGADGSHGKKGGSAPTNGRPGTNGMKGGHGGMGGAAILGNVSVEVKNGSKLTLYRGKPGNGGNGGYGGSGGAGGNGRDAEWWGPSGTAGASGGHGGYGGDGGDVYMPTDQFSGSYVGNLVKTITWSSMQGGKPGKGGAGGLGGKGGAGGAPLSGANYSSGADGYNSPSGNSPQYIVP